MIVFAPLYFISFQIIAGFIVQNLFILIIIQALEYSEQEEELEKIQDLIENFRVTWRLFENNEKPYKLGVKNLLPFLKRLPQPLGLV